MRFYPANGLHFGLYLLLAGGWLVAPLGAAEAVDPQAAAAQQAGHDFFEAKIRPVLVEHCQDCHSADSPESQLAVDSLAGLLRGGARGPAMILGKPEQSLIISAVEHSDRLQMPPKRKLSSAQIADLASWIKQGAPWPNAEPYDPTKSDVPAGALFTPEQQQFWAFQPLATAAPPEVKDTAWVRQPLDRFILAELEAKGLKPAPAADKRTLLRRVTFDLLGLPPTVAEVNAFVADEAPDAYERLIERLLASPHYGERWGRHWLDVARYADSNGLDENLAYANAFRYRDYVVKSMSDDKPYDRFLLEQIAGDLLPVPADESPAARIERLTATGFLSLGPKMLAEDDPVKMEMDIIDEQVDTLSRAFMGLTVGCARCHDHKFDPIPTADYYSLAAIFKSTKTMANFGVVANWNEMPVPTPEFETQKQAYEAQLKAAIEQHQQRETAAHQQFLEIESKRAGRYLLAATELLGPPAPLPAPAANPLPPLQVKDQPAPTGTIAVEAEKFARGTAKVRGNVIGNGGDGKYLNDVEYEIEIPAAGNYQLEFLVANDGNRSFDLYLNWRLVSRTATKHGQGGFNDANAQWCADGIYTLPQGKLNLRLERLGATPHLDRIALIPTQLPATFNTPIGLAKSPVELAKNHDVHSELLLGWVAYLQGTTEVQRALWQAAFDASLPTEAGPKGTELQAKFDAATAAWSAVADKAATKQLADAGLEPFRAALHDSPGVFRMSDKPERFYMGDARKELDKLAKARKELEKNKPQPPAIMAVQDGKVQNLKIHLRGSHTTLGAEVPRQFLRIVAGEQQTPLAPQHSGRLELAQWLVQPSHPLTARVMANRVWGWHFGNPLVRSADNFGRLGERPTHPALLDYLARELQRQQWSLKALHRQILLSSTYRMSTTYSEAGAAADPENKLLWRFDRRRLEAEEVRDALLVCADNLDPAVGGQLMKFKNRDYVTGTGSRTSDYSFNRRSLYLPILRSAVYEVLQAFDFPDPSVLNGQRATTTVAPQALFMMNSDFVVSQSQRIAKSLLARDDRDDAGRIELAYVTIFARPPQPAETTRCLDFLQKLEQANQAEGKPAPRELAWLSLCRVLLASNEFIFLE